jgi:hypothetical protein
LENAIKFDEFLIQRLFSRILSYYWKGYSIISNPDKEICDTMKPIGIHS